MNHFEILGLTEGFELDIDGLTHKFRELQRQYHPDNFATGSEAIKSAALQKSAQINDAYQTLLAPITRAEYLLSLQGIELKTEQQNIKDVPFLMQQMAFRERLEQIEHDGNENELTLFHDEVSSLISNKLKKLSLELTAQDWQNASDSVRKMKFLAKLQSEIERVEEQLF